jgi:hypothetical protein
MIKSCLDMERLYYCTVNGGFLKEFMRNKPAANIEDDNDDIEIWRSVFKYFKKKTFVHLKIKPKEINDQFLANLSNNPEYGLFKILIDAGHTSDYVEIDLSNRNVEHDLLNRSSFSFLNETDGKEFSKIGVENFGSNEILLKWPKYYKPDAVLINDKRSKELGIGWSLLNNYKHSCNSVVICDNYLLSSKNRMLNNLLPILSVLLPDDMLKIPIDLTIVSSYFYNCYSLEIRKYNHPTKQHLIDIKKEVLKNLKNKLGSTQVNLSIVFKELSEYHDRHIFTNNFVLKSGNSFTYFDRQGRSILPSQTVFDIWPFQADNRDKTYGHEFFPLLKSVSDIVQKSEIFIGSKSNRLFNLPKCSKSEV